MTRLCLGLTLLLLSSCGPKKGKLNFDPGDVLPEPEEVSEFSKLQSEVIGPHCLRCHREFAKESEVLKEVHPGDPESSHFFEHVEDGSMPPDRPPLSSEELQIVQDYIESLKPAEHPEEEHGR